MKEKRSFWIVGGDLRQIKLAELLLEDGHQVQTYAVEQRPEQGKLPGDGIRCRGIEEADCVILPLPVMAEHGILNSKLSDRRVPLQLIFQNLRPGQLVCAGKAPPEVRAMAEQAEVVFFDYFAREELEIANAVPTVEGAIQIAMEELPTTLFGTRVLVLGFGRLGKLLAHRLKGAGRQRDRGRPKLWRPGVDPGVWLQVRADGAAGRLAGRLPAGHQHRPCPSAGSCPAGGLG